MLRDFAGDLLFGRPRAEDDFLVGAEDDFLVGCFLGGIALDNSKQIFNVNIKDAVRYRRCGYHWVDLSGAGDPIWSFVQMLLHILAS